ncbi:MAG: Exodeoxyribonuclease 7 small subunit [Firmicutes bacterium ADurb.Bin193]|nr:MAG: Exodeoxyribonuclease 7 small subunit [Firmicutes bacterium ADurb.Bin193]
MSEISFEKAIQELDEIVTKLEKGDLPLNEMLELFEKGIALSRVCNELLSEAEKKVSVLIKNGETYETQEFNPPEGV